MQKHFPGVSRGTVQRLIAGGDLRVEGRVVKPTHIPRAGESIEIRWPEPVTAGAQPEALPLEILFEDEELLVLNKAPGLVVHPSAGHDTGTLVNALLHHCAGRLSGIGGVARPGIVHRLDKDTSGCLVVAKDDTTHLSLSEQFAGREVLKLYVALVCGHPPSARGHIQAPIARHPNHRKRMAVTEGTGREAWTSYRVLERWPEATWVEAELHTGRTRQNKRLANNTGYSAPRQMLHAWRLAFRHPRTGRQLKIEAPWPPDFEEATRRLGATRDAS
jgi:23S rRNA pseudouridine1911/1915/1917 synthase